MKNKPGENEVFAVLAVLDAALAEPVKKPVRAYKPQTQAVKERLFETRLMGYDERYFNHKTGRPKGSKNKPRDPSLPPILRPRVHIDLDHTNAQTYFCIHNDMILRITAGKVGEGAIYKKQGNKKLSRHYHGWLVRFRNRDYDASLVAWWLLRGHVPDGYTVKCNDLATVPRYNADTLYLERSK